MWWSSELNSPIKSILARWFLKCQCSLLPLFTFTTSNLSCYMDLTFQVPMQCCSLQDLSSSITTHNHNWLLLLFWLHFFILSGVISPPISSNILGTYWPGEFIFQCPICLPFQTVHGVLKARILKWFAFPFSSGPHSVCLGWHYMAWLIISLS